MRRRLLLGVLILGAALAGCTGGNDEPPGDAENETPTDRPSVTPRAPPRPGGSPPPNGTLEPLNLSVALQGVPEVAVAGSQLTLAVNVTGTPPRDAAKVRVVVDGNETAGACAAAEGAVPGNFSIACTFDEPGNRTLAARVNLTLEDGSFAVLDSTEHRLRVRPPVGDYRLVIGDAPARPVAPGTSFTVRFHVEGETRDHAPVVEARYGPNSTDAPTRAQLPHACESVASDVPGSFALACDVPADLPAGPYFLRAHVRIPAGVADRVFWSDEHVLVVS